MGQAGLICLRPCRLAVNGCSGIRLTNDMIVFHGIGVNRTEVVLDGSEAPIRIEAEALLASEKLAPTAVLNKIRVPYRPIEAKLCTLPSNRDKLPSGKQILALTLTCVCFQLLISLIYGIICFNAYMCLPFLFASIATSLSWKMEQK
ncbi:hypothetical protein Gotri_012662 [Gossypium trilobum]|uniref:Tripeptidyl peptidase II second Ig-like domain-containing protein n=1 Tax=Gossypium trilobum TaxID=34281 RepID=A0A7J9DR07_9ROSI|nr:hypothetical protein [Gossypium trilobum]